MKKVNSPYPHRPNLLPILRTLTSLRVPQLQSDPRVPPRIFSAKSLADVDISIGVDAGRARPSTDLLRLVARAGALEFLADDLGGGDARVGDGRCVAEVAVDADQTGRAAGSSHTVDFDVALALLHRS